jgi:hypothetical protein
LERRKAKHLDLGLIKFAYPLTSFGCQQSLNAPRDVTIGFSINMTYAHPRRATAKPTAPPTFFDDASYDEDTSETQGIAVEEPEDTIDFQGDGSAPDDAPQPVLANVRHPKSLAFLEEFLMVMLVIDDHEWLAHLTDHARAKPVRKWIQSVFCGDVCNEFCRPEHIDPVITQQVEMQCQLIYIYCHSPNPWAYHNPCIGGEGGAGAVTSKANPDASKGNDFS